MVEQIRYWEKLNEGIKWGSQMEHKTALALRAGTEPCKLELNCLYFTGQGVEDKATKVVSLIRDPLPSNCNPTPHFYPIGELLWHWGKKQIKISTIKIRYHKTVSPCTYLLPQILYLGGLKELKPCLQFKAVFLDWYKHSHPLPRYPQKLMQFFSGGIYLHCRPRR